MSLITPYTINSPALLIVQGISYNDPAGTGTAPAGYFVPTGNVIACIPANLKVNAVSLPDGGSPENAKVVAPVNVAVISVPRDRLIVTVPEMLPRAWMIDATGLTCVST
jgi:hypothetical protein